MTIYVNGANREVSLQLPVVANSINVTVLKNEEEIYEVGLVSYDNQTYKFILPFSLVESENLYTVKWVIHYTENNSNHEYIGYTEVEVVQAILPLSEVKTELGEDATDEEVVRLESAVRHIIQAHTGQTFGKYEGIISITGSGEPYLRLPRKLNKLKTVNGNNYNNARLSIRGEGWYLRTRAYGVPPVRADFDGWHQAPYTNSVPIVAPYSKALFDFVEDAEYEIDGTWGWNSVPAAVQEAARLLVSDYACQDINYRDRYLASVNSADWRLQFNDGAFINTGNVRANELLANYVVKRGWKII